MYTYEVTPCGTKIGVYADGVIQFLVELTEDREIDAEITTNLALCLASANAAEVDSEINLAGDPQQYVLQDFDTVCLDCGCQFNTGGADDPCPVCGSHNTERQS